MVHVTSGVSLHFSVANTLYRNPQYSHGYSHWDPIYSSSWCCTIFWGQTAFILEKSRSLDVFQSCLDSIDKNGLNVPSLNMDYICHYKGSLIGKRFKSLLQVMPFLIYDLIPKTALDGWMVIGELMVLIWHMNILDTEKYLAILMCTIHDFLNMTAQYAPSILISKPKFHFLVHLPAYIQWFGPSIIFSTECYESFNHIFHLSCIHSNHQAPSKDSCKTFAHHNIVKHIATGGFWFDSNQKRWVRGAKEVQIYLQTHPT